MFGNYNEDRAFLDVVLSNENDVRDGRELYHLNACWPRAYDTSEITEDSVDIDMLMFRGLPDLLKGIDGFPGVFGFHEDHPQLNDCVIISIEPWIIGFDKKFIKRVQDQLQRKIKHYPKGTSKKNPFPLSKRIGKDKLVDILNSAGVDEVVIYQYGMKTSLMDGASTIHRFRKLDPHCQVHFDLATEILAHSVEGATTTLLAHSPPDGTQRCV